MPAIPNSILDSTKKMLGLDADYDAFDLDIITHINSTFAQLQQLGVGPDDGFFIDDSSALWIDFLGSNKLINSVKTYMYLKVRMFFDPPTTSFALTATQDQIKELEWRLNVAADKGYIIPVVVDPDEDLVAWSAGDQLVIPPEDPPADPVFWTTGT